MNKHLEKLLKEIPYGAPLRDVVTREWVEAVQGAIASLARGEHISVEGGMMRLPGSKGVRLGVRQAKGGRRWGGTAAGPCYFGEIISINDETEYVKGIRGGVIFAGDKVWRVPYQGINTDADFEKLVWIRVPVTANADASKTVALQGLATSTEPVWENGDLSAGYPDQSIPPMFPDHTDPTGEAILPIGVLRVASGVATLERTGCGNFLIQHCPGTLVGTRTSDTADSTSV